MLIQIFARTNCIERSSEPILNCRIERDGDIDVLRASPEVWSIIRRAAEKNISRACRLRSRHERLCRAAEAKERARAGCRARRRPGRTWLKIGEMLMLAQNAGRFPRTWLCSLVSAAGRFDFLQNLKDARAAFDRIVEMKNKMRCVFQNNVAGEFSLQCGTMRFQFINHARAGVPVRECLRTRGRFSGRA